MKKILCTASLAIALSVNPGAAYAQSSISRFLQEIAVQVLSEMATEAAKQTLINITRPIPQISTFTDREWLVTIKQSGDDLIYTGVNIKSRDSIMLRGVRVSSSSDRRVFTWNNGAYRYQVAQRPSDPQFVRLQVFDGRGKELLNRKLEKVNR
ncbi:hypothetical protein [Oscillatoria sp. FACHB-1406]|uniref:hypothetical protein n=1 Tax=Oscillatoria sp. FACHB-1406 TaxID=2692846 RepID=UPI00168386AE|nr:hypothetical protein [Oscillatoria sp. FACHB-1406]MBD2579922.1 hypothetical protein [Oscillatoria sp. FACHB-1406]